MKEALNTGGVTAVDAAATEMLHSTISYAAFLGIEVLSATPEDVRARVAWDPQRLTTGGGLHGGLLMSLADTCGAMAAFLNLPEGSAGTSTIESKTNFLRPVRDGYLYASGRTLHVGRSTIVVETELTDDDGRLVAKTIQTQAVLRGG